MKSPRADRTGAFAQMLAAWFVCGYAPKARGTWGALGALVPAILLAQYAGWRPMHFLILGVAALPVSIWAADVTAKRLGQEDPPLVVLDEVVGMWISLAGATVLNWKSWLAAFVLFRIMDIWKPAPVRQLERLPGGWGIMADDVMAGIYAALVLFIAGCFNLY